MNLRDTNPPATDMLDAGISAVWPGSSSDDIIRRQLATLLLEDPDHRLRVAHLEPLLHLRVSSHIACSSGRLQALLTDPENARIFPVDFSNTRVADWRSRVVYLDVHQLAKEVAAAKQQQHGSTGLSSGRTSCEPPSGLHLSSMNGNCGSLGAVADAPAGDVTGAAYSQQQHLGPGIGNGSLQDGRPDLSNSLGHQPMLESIFSANSGLSTQSRGQAGVAPGAGRAPGGAGGLSGSYGTVVGSAGTAEHRPGSVSLFGSSFEVPHAIASCWAPSSSCGSGTGSDRGPAGAAAAAAAGKGHHGPGALDAHEACGGSSTASGSSSRSVNAATRAAAAAASRLRKASSNHGADGHDFADANGGQQLSAVYSSGALSGLDASTPKSCVNGADTSASPVNSSACEDEVEYNEAQLVFGLPGAAPANGTVDSNIAGSDTTPVAAAALAGDQDGVGAAAGEGGEASADTTPLHGVDWSKVAALQQHHHQHHLQQQQHQLGSSWQQQHGLQSCQPSLLFGLDDLHQDLRSGARHAAAGQAYGGLGLSSLPAAAAAGAQTARLMMDASELGQNSSGFLGSSVGSGFARGATSGVGSAPVDASGLRNLFLPGGSIDMAGSTGMAAYGASAGMGAGLGFGATAAAATAAELAAESVLLDAEAAHRLPAGSQQHMSAFVSHISSSFSSAGLLSERSSSGCWGASPAAHGYGLMQQQPQRQQQQQQSSEAVGDIGLRSDQLKEPGGRVAAAGSLPTKPEGTAAADKAAAAPAPGSAPRLTGWASIAAREPKASPLTPRSAAAAARDAHTATGPRQHAQQAASAGAAAKAVEMGKALQKLPVRVRNEVHGLVGQYAGVLKVDDFDEGVVHQLNAKRSEEEAVAAVRHIAHYDLANIQHMAAYLNHLVKHYNHNAAAAAAAASEGPLVGAGTPGATATTPASSPAAARAAAGAGGPAAAAGHMLANQGCTLGSTLGSSSSSNNNRGASGTASSAAAAAAGGSLGAYGGQIRLASVPVSTKSMLQKLPLKVFRQLEQLVAGCAFLEWRHFDAGVVKVLAQLSKLCEADVFEELELLAATDLSNVEYMPAYLNKRLNNKLWSRRKALGDVPSS